MSKKKILLLSTVVLSIGLLSACNSSKDKETVEGAMEEIAPAATERNFEMSASADGVAIWQFPDKRELDPELFGTPQNPLSVRIFPLDQRDVNEAGTTYTTIKNPSMFSNKIKETRDRDFKVGFGVAQPDKLEIHLAMPPLKGSPTGPVASPLPTGVTLPNGAEQPFIHVNFYGNIKITGNQFIQ